MIYIGDHATCDVMHALHVGICSGLMLEYVCTPQVLANPSTDMQEGSAVSLEDLHDQGVRPYDEKARWPSFVRWVMRDHCTGAASQPAC